RTAMRSPHGSMATDVLVPSGSSPVLPGWRGGTFLSERTDMDRAKCSVCGGEYPVKKDGNLWKHEGLNEEVCSGKPVAEDELDVEVLEKGSDYKVTAETFSLKANPKPAPKKSEKVYTTHVDVKNPPRMVHDENWQNNQKRMVVREMESKGISPDGPVECVSIETLNAKRTRVTYKVPHK